MRDTICVSIMFVVGLGEECIYMINRINRSGHVPGGPKKGTVDF